MRTLPRSTSPRASLRTRRAAVAGAALAATLAFAACGSSDETASSGVTPDAAKTSVERAAHLRLTAEKVPAAALDQGLRASYSNASTAAKDRQVVGLFVMKSAGVAHKVADLVRTSAPKSAQLIVNGKVMVVYAAAGSDRRAAVERAVKAL
jgi:hypothetical protein